MPSSQAENQLDNDKEELRQSILVEFRQVHKLAPSDYTRNCTNVVMSLIDQYTQSKLKAFAGDMEEAIGEDEYPDQHFPTVLQGENIEKYDKVTARDRLRAELRQALKAIKEKYQL